MRFVATSNEQRQYDKVPMPPGLLVIGDAVQVVDPCYGQASVPMPGVAAGEAHGKASPGPGAYMSSSCFPYCFPLLL